MTTEQLQKVIHATPFQPFALRLADGWTHEIPHPDFIAHKPGSRIALVVTDDAGSGESLDLLLVVGIVVAARGEAAGKAA